MSQKTVICPDCGHETTEAHRFCPRCGTELIAPAPPVAQSKIACPECGKRTDSEHEFCPHCGYWFTKRQPVKRAATSDRPERTPHTARNILILLAALAALLVCERVFRSGDTGGVPSEANTSVARVATRTESPKSTPTVQPSPTPAPIAPPYSQIRETVEGMTEAQWKPYLASLKGQRVVGWQGWVTDVDVELSGQYELWVDMDPPDSPFSSQDVYLHLPEEVALALKKGQRVTFSGLIARAGNILGSVSISLEEASLK